ncbi:unnamed protein product [Caretta caretta]
MFPVGSSLPSSSRLSARKGNTQFLLQERPRQSPASLGFSPAVHVAGSFPLGAWYVTWGEPLGAGLLPCLVGWVLISLPRARLAPGSPIGFKKSCKGSLLRLREVWFRFRDPPGAAGPAPCPSLLLQRRVAAGAGLGCRGLDLCACAGTSSPPPACPDIADLRKGKLPLSHCPQGAMAAASPVESLQEEATCPVCLEYFTDPVTLECGHNLCRACSAQCWEGPDTAASCPQCRETVQQRNLRPNRQLANMDPIWRVRKRREMRIGCLTRVGRRNIQELLESGSVTTLYPVAHEESSGFPTSISAQHAFPIAAAAPVLAPEGHSPDSLLILISDRLCHKRVLTAGPGHRKQPQNEGV